jgi:hypothetical protein
MRPNPGRLARRSFLQVVVAAGALCALPPAALASTPSYYGRGYKAGGYR